MHGRRGPSPQSKIAAAVPGRGVRIYRAGRSAGSILGGAARGSCSRGLVDSGVGIRNELHGGIATSAVRQVVVADPGVWQTGWHRVRDELRYARAGRLWGAQASSGSADSSSR